MPPELAIKLVSLRERYIAELPATARRLAELLRHCQRLSWSARSIEPIQLIAHQLAGSLGIHELDVAQSLASSIDKALEKETNVETKEWVEDLIKELIIELAHYRPVDSE